jgi:D-serine deaminase-like pyridoxal phosphate-dependent protein
VVIDAGSKTLTSDQCLPAPESGYGLVVGFEHARIARLSEEHAQVDVSKSDRKPVVGETVAVIPNHICPCVNLQSELWWKEGDEPLRRVAVDARGTLE